MEEKKPIIPLLNDSNIETVDLAMFNFINDTLNLHCTTNEGWKKVPVIWSHAERAYQIKNNKEMRDKYGTIIAPLISVDRTAINKDLTKKGSFQANLAPNRNRYVVSKVLNQEKTSNFANADSLKANQQVNFITSKKNKKQVYEYTTVPIPVYVMIDYKIQIFTNYQQQMNELIQPLITRTGAINYFVISHESHRFECFIDTNFSQETISELADEERKYKCTITIKALGQLIGEGENQERPQTKTFENAVEVKIPKENIIFVGEETGKKKTVVYPSNYGQLVTATIPTKKVFTIGDGSNSVYTVPHNLNSRDLYIIVRENSGDYAVVQVAISYTDLNNISIDMGDIISSNSYVVTILG